MTAVQTFVFGIFTGATITLLFYIYFRVSRIADDLSDIRWLLEQIDKEWRMKGKS